MDKEEIIVLLGMYRYSLYGVKQRAKGLSLRVLKNISDTHIQYHKECIDKLRKQIHEKSKRKAEYKKINREAFTKIFEGK